MVEFTLEKPKDNSAPEFGDNLSKQELKRAVKEYAEWFVSNNSALSEVELDSVRFKISKRCKRAAGLAGYRGNIENLYLKMAWRAYQSWGWNQDWTDTIEHELIHIWQFQVHGEANHGITFKRKAREIDAPRHCKRFTDFKYEFYCEQCGELVGGKYKMCKTVKNHDRLQSKCCNAGIELEEN